MEVKITNAILSEQADSDSRKRNVLILGVTESISNLSTENERKDEIHKIDKEKVEKILDTIGANKSNVVSIVRFKPKTQSNRPPPILIRFEEDIHRNSTLLAAKKLRSTTVYKDVFINADLTEKERIQEREIHEQKKILRENQRMESQE